MLNLYLDWDILLSLTFLLRFTTHKFTLFWSMESTFGAYLSILIKTTSDDSKKICQSYNILPPTFSSHWNSL